MHHFPGTSPSPTQAPPPRKQKHKTQKTTAPTFVQFPFFLQTSFCPPPLPPTQGKPGSLQRSLSALFLIKSTSSALEAVEDGGYEAARSVGTAPPSLQPSPHVRAVGSIPVSAAEGELATPCRGSPSKRATVTVLRRDRPGRTEPRARSRQGPGARDPSRRSHRGRGLRRAPGDADSLYSPRPQGMTQRFLRTPALPACPRSIPGKAPAGDSLRQRIPRWKGQGSPGCENPSARGPKPSRTADPAWGSRAGSMTAGCGRCPGAPPAARKECQSPPRES